MSSKYKIKPDIKDQILERIKNEGIPVSQVAKDHGISETTIYKWLGRSTEAPSFREIQQLKKENKALLEIIGAMTLKMSESKKKN